MIFKRFNRFWWWDPDILFLKGCKIGIKDICDGGGGKSGAAAVHCSGLQEQTQPNSVQDRAVAVTCCLYGGLEELIVGQI